MSSLLEEDILDYYQRDQEHEITSKYSPSSVLSEYFLLKVLGFEAQVQKWGQFENHNILLT